MTSNPSPQDQPPPAVDHPQRSATEVSTDDLLPPVEPPNAGFIIQLFVVPAVIVAGVVLLWLAFNWIARPRVADPEQIVHSLRSSNQARFQRAKALVDMLRMPQRYQLNDNQQLCLGLAEMLSEMVDTGDDAESEVTMRFILAGALGEFYIDDGLDALIKAAQEDPERDIRRKAVNAIAVLGQTFVQRDPPEALTHPDLVPLLATMANQPDDELLRSEAAFTIGALVQAPDVDSRLIDELALLAEDFYPDARYNAALGLARIGDLRAVETITEMLDLDVIEASVRGERKFSDQVSDESLARQRAEKRNLILRNAIVAAESLAMQRSVDELASIESALRQFVSAAAEYDDTWPIPGSIVESARSALLRIDDDD